MSPQCKLTFVVKQSRTIQHAMIEANRFADGVTNQDSDADDYRDAAIDRFGDSGYLVTVSVRGDDNPVESTEKLFFGYDDVILYDEDFEFEIDVPRGADIRVWVVAVNEGTHSPAATYAGVVGEFPVRPPGYQVGSLTCIDHVDLPESHLDS